MLRTPAAATASAVELAAVLLLATAASDLLGLASASFYLLVAAVPVTAVAGLVCFARMVDGIGEERLSRVQSILCACLVAAIVLGAAAREPELARGSVPAAATAALVLGFVLLAAQAGLALAVLRRQAH